MSSLFKKISLRVGGALIIVPGGIGVTPFRSILKYLFDTKDVRTVTFSYTGGGEQDFVYGDVFDTA